MEREGSLATVLEYHQMPVYLVYQKKPAWLYQPNVIQWMRFANDFHPWLRRLWKSLDNRLTRDPKNVFHGNWQHNHETSPVWA